MKISLLLLMLLLMVRVQATAGFAVAEAAVVETTHDSRRFKLSDLLDYEAWMQNPENKEWINQVAKNLADQPELRIRFTGTLPALTTVHLDPVSRLRSKLLLLSGAAADRFAFDFKFVEANDPVLEREPLIEVSGYGPVDRNRAEESARVDARARSYLAHVGANMSQATLTAFQELDSSMKYLSSTSATSFRWKLHGPLDSAGLWRLSFDGINGKIRLRYPYSANVSSSLFGHLELALGLQRRIGTSAWVGVVAGTAFAPILGLGENSEVHVVPRPAMAGGVQLAGEFPTILWSIGWRWMGRLMVAFPGPTFAVQGKPSYQLSVEAPLVFPVWGPLHITVGPLLRFFIIPREPSTGSWREVGAQLGAGVEI